MSLRLQRIAFYYRSFLHQFYSRRPPLESEPYAAQHSALMGACFAYADFYSRALRSQGYEAQEIVRNAEPLQKRWAQENGVRYDEARWMTDIVLAQVKAFRPDVLWLGAGDPNFGPEFIRQCREQCPSIRLVLGWQGEPATDAAHFREHDLALVSDPGMLAHLRSQGVPVCDFKHAFEPDILERLKRDSAESTEAIDIGFIGQFAFGEHYHNQRAKVFAEVSQQIPLTIFSDVPSLGAARGLKKYARDGYYAMFRQLRRAGLEAFARRLPRYQAALSFESRRPYLDVFDTLARKARPPVFGLDMYRTLASFKIGLNGHISRHFASNMRLFEATGVGICLLTDWRPNLGDLFEPDVEVVTYRGVEECVEKARYLLDHEAERRAIAAAGQRRTLREHTINSRMIELDEIIRERLRRRG